MKIESTHAQIIVRDSQTSVGGNIHNRLSGYAADISFWDGAVYLCRREGDPLLHIVLVPSKKWEGDLALEGLTVLTKLPTLHEKIESIVVSYKQKLCTFCGKPENDREHDFKSEDCNHAFTTQKTEP